MAKNGGFQSRIAKVGLATSWPSRDGRLLHLRLSASSVELAGTQPSPIRWTYHGSLGLVRSPTHLHWVVLSPWGLREAEFDLNRAEPSSAADRCMP
jgi:hypothetical protein